MDMVSWISVCVIFIAIRRDHASVINFFDKEDDDFCHHITFQIYRSTLDSYKTISLQEIPHNVPKVMNTKQTIVFYFPGWSEEPSKHNSAVDSLVKAMLQREDILPIVVNYEHYVGSYNGILGMPLCLLLYISDYYSAVKKINKIGKCVAKSLFHLVKSKKLNMRKTRIIGGSLGAQIASKVGKEFHQISNTMLPRITGLDPAGPLFHPPQALSKDDAEFVDIIHTNPGVFGYKYSTGHADFYPNHPFPYQPGCSILYALFQGNIELTSCSHSRVVEYFVESITKPKSFPSCHLNLWYRMGLCHMFPTDVFMGYDVNTKAYGVFVLSVNSESPYGLG